MSRKCLIFLAVLLVVVMAAGCSKESPAAKPQEESAVQTNEPSSLPQTEGSQPPAQSELEEPMLNTDKIPAILVEYYDIESWDSGNPNMKMWQVSADGTGAFSKRELESYYFKYEWYEDRWYDEGVSPDGLILVGRNGKYGFIDSDGNEVIKAEWDEAKPFSEGFATVKKDGRYGYINTQGELVINMVNRTPNDSILRFGDFHDGLARFHGLLPNNPAMHTLRYGYVDTNGNAVIKPQFIEAKDFVNGYAVVKNDSGLWGVIDTSGNYVIEPTWSDESYGDSPRFIIADQGTKGWFIEQSPFDDSVLLQVNDRMERTVYYYDYNGTMTFQHSLDETRLIGTELLYNRDTKTISQNGRVIHENVAWVDSYSYFESMRVIRIGEKTGLIDGYGNFIMEPQNKIFLIFNRGLPGFQDNGRFGYIDKFGNEVIAAKFDAIGAFSNGIAKAMLNDKWGLIDTDGKFIIEPQYDNIGDPWIDEWIAVEVDGKWGFIDKNDHFVIEPQFDGVTDFHGNIAFVWQEGLCGVISRSGSFIAEPANTFYHLIYEGGFMECDDIAYGKAYEPYMVSTPAAPPPSATQ